MLDAVAYRAVWIPCRGDTVLHGILCRAGYCAVRDTVIGGEPHVATNNRTLQRHGRRTLPRVGRATTHGRDYTPTLHASAHLGATAACVADARRVVPVSQPQPASVIRSSPCTLEYPRTLRTLEYPLHPRVPSGTPRTLEPPSYPGASTPCTLEYPRTLRTLEYPRTLRTLEYPLYPRDADDATPARPSQVCERALECQSRPPM
jgi:hypothetical protein